LTSDLTLIYRIVHSLSAVDSSAFFTLCNSSTRVHQMKLMKQFCRVNSRAFCFYNTLYRCMERSIWRYCICVITVCR